MTTPGTIDEPFDRGRAGVSELKEQFDALAWKIIRTESTWYARFGLTRMQAITLHAIEEFGPDIDMATLITMTSLPPSSITSVVDRLVDLGYATRDRDGRDRRRVTAAITETGRTTVTRMEASNTRLLASLLEGISDAEIATVTRVFRHMTERSEQISLDPEDPQTP